MMAIPLLKPLGYVFSFLVAACASHPKVETHPNVSLQKFMGPWFVLAGRFTFVEKDAYNSVESYRWNEEAKRIDIDFTFNKGSFEGEKKSVPQKGWVEDKTTNSRWKVSPFWPLKFDYLILDVADDYSWTAVGVPDQKHFWIMARDWKTANVIIDEVVKRVAKKGYDARIETRVPHLH